MPALKVFDVVNHGRFHIDYAENSTTVYYDCQFNGETILGTGPGGLTDKQAVETIDFESIVGSIIADDYWDLVSVVEPDHPIFDQG